MDGNGQNDVGEMLNLISTTWKGLILSAGMSSGILGMLDEKEPVSITEIEKKTGYDWKKLEKWFYYSELNGIVGKVGYGYVITPFARLATSASPIKEIYGLANLIEFYSAAAANAKECFHPKRSLDKLSDGKISRDYQPRVSDNLSAILFKNFQEYEMAAGDTLLDMGCGNASFLRKIAKLMPQLKIAGVDSNLFAIELGKKENINLGLADQIKLYVGDLTSDMSDFGNESYDWVTAINIFHFVPPESRMYIIDNIIRIAKKGIFMTQGVLEPSPITSAGNPLMALLWNDFSGFFKMSEVDKLNEEIQVRYPKYEFIKTSVIQGTAYLVTILKK